MTCRQRGDIRTKGRLTEREQEPTTEEDGRNPLLLPAFRPGHLAVSRRTPA